MKRFDHPHIVKLLEIYEDSRTSAVVLEVCEGGPLLDRIQKAGHLSEMHVSTLAHQILHAVHYLHARHHVCHRDVTLESFVLVSKDCVEENAVKLTDFGFAKI